MSSSPVTGSEIVTARVEFPDNLIALLKGSDIGEGEIIILPSSSSFIRGGGYQSDKGRYEIGDVHALKSLRSHGANVRLFHDEAHRTIIGEFSQNELIALSLFIGEALGEEAVTLVAGYLISRIRAALGRRQPVRVEVEIARMRRGDMEIEGFKISGDGERVVDGIVRLLGDHSSGENTGHDSD